MADKTASGSHAANTGEKLSPATNLVLKEKRKKLMPKRIMDARKAAGFP